MKHELSACILIPTLASYTVQLKQGLKCMHSVHVSSQLLVSGLFIAVPTNAKNLNFFPILVCMLFLFMQSHSQLRMLNRKHAVFNCTGRIITWLCDGGLIEQCNLNTHRISVITNSEAEVHNCKLCTELSSQVFYRLSIIILSEIF